MIFVRDHLYSFGLDFTGMYVQNIEENNKYVNVTREAKRKRRMCV